MGLLNLAVRQAEGIEWAMRVGNKPVAMASLRVVLDMWIGLTFISGEPKYRERRACQLLLESPERTLRMMAAGPAPALPPALVDQGRKAIEKERDDLLHAIATLPKGPDDKDRWTSRPRKPEGLSTGRRAKLGGFELHYDFL